MRPAEAGRGGPDAGVGGHRSGALLGDPSRTSAPVPDRRIHGLGSSLTTRIGSSRVGFPGMRASSPRARRSEAMQSVSDRPRSGDRDFPERRTRLRATRVALRRWLPAAGTARRSSRPTSTSASLPPRTIRDAARRRVPADKPGANRPRPSPTLDTLAVPSSWRRRSRLSRPGLPAPATTHPATDLRGLATQAISSGQQVTDRITVAGLLPGRTRTLVTIDLRSCWHRRPVARATVSTRPGPRTFPVAAPFRPVAGHRLEHVHVCAPSGSPRHRSLHLHRGGPDRPGERAARRRSAVAPVTRPRSSLIECSCRQPSLLPPRP